MRMFYACPLTGKRMEVNNNLYSFHPHVTALYSNVKAEISLQLNQISISLKSMHTNILSLVGIT